MEIDTKYLHEGKQMSINRTALAALLFIMILGVALSGCNPGVTTAPENSTPTAITTPVSGKTYYQQVANALKALQPTVVPDNLLSANSTKNGMEFDVNADFSVLKHLSMQEGYVLDYIYLSNGADGGPILYVRSTEAEPFKTYDEYKEATHQNPRSASDNSLIWLVKDAKTGVFGNKISADGTKDGFFQLALLQALGNQFYLLGGAQINDKRLVCETEELEKILNEIQTTANVTLTDDFVKSAHDLELKPEISTKETLVTVTFTTFSKYGGFYREIVTMMKTYPNIITDRQSQLILSFD
jgi:hypothetical protein